jgi:PAS domain S-box-containing protein
VFSAALPVTVLVVDDLPASRGLAAIWLSDGLRDAVRVVEAATLAEMWERWRAERPDVVLLDHRLPDGEGLEAAGALLAEDPDAAIVLLTGMADPALDQEAERVGITDFLVKHEIDGPMLARTVRYALRRREDRRRLRRSEERYRNLVAALPDTGVLVVDDALRFTMVAGSALEDAGWDPAELVGQSAEEVLRAGGRDTVLEHYRAALAGEARELEHTSPNGRTYRTAFGPLGGHEAMAVRSTSPTSWRRRWSCSGRRSSRTPGRGTGTRRARSWRGRRSCAGSTASARARRCRRSASGCGRWSPRRTATASPT